MATSRTASNQWRNVRNYHLRLARERGQEHCPLCSNALDWTHKTYPNRPEVDHIIPVALGGTEAADNLRVICAGCNRRMGAKLGRQAQLGNVHRHAPAPEHNDLTSGAGEPHAGDREPFDPGAPLRTSRAW